MKKESRQETQKIKLTLCFFSNRGRKDQGKYLKNKLNFAFLAMNRGKRESKRETKKNKLTFCLCSDAGRKREDQGKYLKIN